MRKKSNTYSHLARKALRLSLTVFLFVGLLPDGIHAQSPCTGMRCHSNGMLGMHNSGMESLKNAMHGCCSGVSGKPCALEPFNRIELPDCALGCYRGSHQQSLSKVFIELDTFSQNQRNLGFYQGHLPVGKTGLPPIYLQTLSLRF